jgi:hypothetical protein
MLGLYEQHVHFQENEPNHSQSSKKDSDRFGADAILESVSEVASAGRWEKKSYSLFMTKHLSSFHIYTFHN